MRIEVGVLAVKSNQLQTDSHGSDVMATESSNGRLLNDVFIGALTQESGPVASTKKH